MPPRKAPANETPAAAFKRLASLRMTNALHAISLCGKLANDSTYDFTPAQFGKMVNDLRSAVNDVESRFKNPGKSTEAPAYQL